jgi:hypothetical protein
VTIGAAPFERSGGRITYRNGTYPEPSAPRPGISGLALCRNMEGEAELPVEPDDI